MKKKIWIASLVAALSITAAAGGIAIANQDTVVTSAAETWAVGEMDEKYLYGTSMVVPEATVEVNGQKVAATATVTYPNGLTTTSDNVQLTQAGVYTITYRAVVGDTHCVQEKTFTVEDKAYLVSSDKSSVQYGHYSNYGSNSDGLLVRLAEGDSLTFSQLMEFNSLTATDKIIEGFVTPDARGVYDFSRIIITLTDPIDSSIYLRIQVRKWHSDINGLKVTYVDAAGNGQSPVGCESGVHKINTYGTPIGHTFSAVENEGGKWNTAAVDCVPDINRFYITYDSDTMEVKAQGKHVSNLNNLEYYETAWNPFPSGKARVTITAADYSTPSANFCITELFGIEDLSDNAFEENGAPMLDVAMSQDEMPQGQVGYEYAIPEATAFDYYSGVCDVKTSVYRDYATANPISVGVVNGKFKPTTAGWYTIVYSATDMLGNTGVELRNVYVAQDLGEIEVTLPENVQTSATLGSWVPVGAVTYTGDCGYTSVKTTVTFGEETYEITDGFLPEVTGDWTIKYTVTDYIGRVGTAEYTVSAAPGDGYIILDQLVLPQIFVSDSEYVLPVIYAKDYSSGKAEDKLCSVVVTDKNGEKTYAAGDAFIPSVAENGDKVKVSYQYDGEELVAKEVPAVLVKDVGKIIAKNYLYGEGFSTSYKDEADEWYASGIAVIADEASELCGWTFATPQLTNGFSVTLESIAAYAKFESLVLTLTDSKNSDEQISIALKVRANGTTITVGETVVDISTVSLAADGEYTIGYNGGKFTVGGVSIAANKMANGEAFTGFSSNLVYVRVDMVNPAQGARYKFNAICGSNISRRNLEVFAPNFEILGDFGGNMALNTVYEIYPAVANDVFAPITSLTLTVIAPDGTVVVDNDGVKLEKVPCDKSYFITLSQYGKYQATYDTVEKDWVAENALSVVKSIFVIDEVAPQVAFINATQTTAKVGDVITMPDLVFQDNITANENMLVERGVYNPNGTLYLFEETENAIKCSYAGKYKFIAMVLDEHGNMTSVTHVVTVTEN